MAIKNHLSVHDIFVASNFSLSFLLSHCSSLSPRGDLFYSFASFSRFAQRRHFLSGRRSTRRAPTAGNSRSLPRSLAPSLSRCSTRSSSLLPPLSHPSFLRLHSLTETIEQLQVYYVSARFSVSRECANCDRFTRVSTCLHMYNQAIEASPSTSLLERFLQFFFELFSSAFVFPLCIYLCVNTLQERQRERSASDREAKQRTSGESTVIETMSK